ncbi:MAG: GNAT family N-acetyltransferase [Clostridiales bacterium]|jgi:ribosomal protein S18 acetylase RimI-like enzyme|nr:GNAT family N-acetyltransferase [Clostridiales bacterium]
MVTIRNYEVGDFENLQKICLATGPKIKSEKHKLSQLALYCDYFAEYEPENLFVAANESGEAVGYIMCSTDFKKFEEQMKGHYLKIVRAYSLLQWLMSRAEIIIDKRLLRKYAAFMHIDILEGYQRMGVGSRLVDTLVAHLNNLGIAAVMLGVGSGNVKGVSFYKKYGFHVIMSGKGFYKMGYHCDGRDKTANKQP